MQEQIKENRKELKESAAQSAALAGLFQPYSVGKFNATAAVGGYRDEQAIAVGVGYRFTENVAGKSCSCCRWVIRIVECWCEF